MLPGTVYEVVFQSFFPLEYFRLVLSTRLVASPTEGVSAIYILAEWWSLKLSEFDDEL